MLLSNEITKKYYFKGQEITYEEFLEIEQIILNRPIPPSDAQDYRLDEQNSWELYALE